MLTFVDDQDTERYQGWMCVESVLNKFEKQHSSKVNTDESDVEAYARTICPSVTESDS